MKSSIKRRNQILGVIDAKRAERMLEFLANTPMQETGPAPETGYEFFHVNYPDFKRPQIVEKLLSDFPEVFGPIEAVDQEHLTWWMSRLMTMLRTAWDSPDSRCREWYLFLLRSEYHKASIRTPALTRFGGLTREVDQFSYDLSILEAEFETSSPGDHKELLGRAFKQAEENFRRNVGELGKFKQIVDEQQKREYAPPSITPMEAAVYHLQLLGDRARHCPNPECPAPYFIATKKGQKYCSTTCAAPSQRESKRKWWHEHRGKGGA